MYIYIFCINPKEMFAYDVALITAGDAFAQRKSKADASHYKSWIEYCVVMGANPVRPAVEPASGSVGYLREIVLCHSQKSINDLVAGIVWHDR